MGGRAVSELGEAAGGEGRDDGLTVSGLVAYSIGQKAWMKAHGIRCVYAVGPVDGKGPTKFGYTVDLKSRCGGMQTGNWVQLRVFATWYAANEVFAKRLEAKCHDLLDKAGKRLRGEWFDIPGEWAGKVIRTAATAENISIVTHGQVLDAMDKVIRRAGTSPDSLYRHFRPLDDVFLQMLSRPAALEEYMDNRDEMARQERRRRRLAKLEPEGA